jgi:hypothetical protein
MGRNPKNREMNQVTQEYRTHLVEARQKAFEDFDKTVLTLSGGALAVSIAFIKDLLGSGPLYAKTFLLTSWSCWAASLLTVLVSHYLSQLTLNRAIKEIDAGSRFQRPGGMFRFFTLVLNALSGFLFVTGLILLIVFVWDNLEALNVRSK